MPKELVATGVNVETGEEVEVRIPLFIAFPRCTSQAWGIERGDAHYAFALSQNLGCRTVHMFPLEGGPATPIEVPLYLVDITTHGAVSHLWRECVERTTEEGEGGTEHEAA